MRFLPNWLSTDFKPSSLQLLDIAYIVEQTLKNLPSRAANSLTEILEDDLAARKEAEQLIELRVKE